MSISKAQAQADATAAANAAQLILDNNFIASADVVIQSAIATGRFQATLALTKGVSGANVLKHYQDLGYMILLPGVNGVSFGFPQLDYYTYGMDYFNLDQPQGWFGYLYQRFFEPSTPNQMICDGKKPFYMYLSWAPPQS